MNIFREMHESRKVDSDWEYSELHRMLSQAISRGFVRRVPLPDSRRSARNAEWYQDTETGEIHSLTPRDERTEGGWEQAELINRIDPKLPQQ